MKIILSIIYLDINIEPALGQKVVEITFKFSKGLKMKVDPDYMKWGIIVTGSGYSLMMVNASNWISINGFEPNPLPLTVVIECYVMGLQSVTNINYFDFVFFTLGKFQVFWQVTKYEWWKKNFQNFWRNYTNWMSGILHLFKPKLMLQENSKYNENHFHSEAFPEKIYGEQVFVVHVLGICMHLFSPLNLAEQ